MNNWHDMETDPPPTTEALTGSNSLVWYDIMYSDGVIGKGCWWHNHWYQNAYWTEIVAWKEEDE